MQRAWHKYVTNRYEFQDMTATCSSMSDFSRCPRNVEWTNTRPHSLRIVRDPGVAREIYNATPSRFECLASKLVNRIIIFKTVAIRSHDNIIEQATDWTPTDINRDLKHVCNMYHLDTILIVYWLIQIILKEENVICIRYFVSNMQTNTYIYIYLYLYV